MFVHSLQVLSDSALTTEPDRSAELDRLFDLLAGFPDAAVTARGENGELWSRPAVLVEPRGEHLELAASLSPAQRAALDRGTEVNVTLHGKRRFVSLSGQAALFDDAQRLEWAWPLVWKVAPPTKVAGDRLTLIHVRPRSGELWDAGEHRITELSFARA